MAQRARIVLIVAVSLAAGCMGSPKPAFYALSPASGAAAGSAIASQSELGLVVGPLEFPRYLDRPELVWRDGANSLTVEDAHRWGGSLRTDVLRVVADDLGRLLGTSRVTIYPTEPSFRARYRVLIDMREFEGVAGDKVVLRAVWTIAAVTDGRALAIEESQIEVPIASSTSADRVGAQSAALGGMSRAIAERIAELR